MTRRRTSFLRFVAPLSVLLGLVLIFFYKLAFTDWILARGDTYAYFYPYWAARDAALSAGRLPLWSPDLFMGVPLLANSQLGTFYPPNWLTIGLAPPDAIRISILLHIGWAALGAFWLARRVVRLEVIPALTAASIFALGGYVGAHVEQINQLQGIAWMPWLFLLFDRSLIGRGDSPSRPYNIHVLLLAMAWALQLFTGHTQTVFITGVGLGFYGLVHHVTQIKNFRFSSYPHPPPPSPNIREGENDKSLSPLSIVWGGNLGVGTSESLQTDKAQNITPFSLRFFASFARLRFILILLFAAILAILLALPQLIPSQELASLSNRGNGLNQQQAMAFSFNPLIAGRGLLPSYDAQPFTEYIAYVGVIGLGLALIGAFSAERKKWVWIALTLAGVFLALGLYNPLYWPLATLPGFNLFRVPARWLALFALGMAMLAGIGMQQLTQKRPPRRLLVGIVGLSAALMAASLLATRAPAEIDSAAAPTALTWAGWIGALLVLLVGIFLIEPPSHQEHQEINEVGTRNIVPLRTTLSNREDSHKKSSLRFFAASRFRGKVLLLFAVLIELWFAAQTLPYNDLSDPAVYDQTRFPVDLMQVYNEGQTPPGRLLSISNLGFDPGDRPTLEARWAAMGISDRAARYAFTAAKMQETLASNLPLIWGIPTIDGYDGGLLPTLYYTAFSSLLLPEGALRTIDGRLRENLALPECRGACLPQERWLDLTNTRYLLVDKVYDLVYDGIFYDTTFEFNLDAGEYIWFNEIPEFEATTLNILYNYDADMPDEQAISADIALAAVDGLQGLTPLIEDTVAVDNLRLVRLGLESSATTPFSASQIRVNALTDMRIRALSLVDTRTGDFIQLTPDGWRRTYSAEVKIYENTDVLPRAFIVHDALVFPDTWDGTEQALAAMRAPAFDPSQTVTLNGEPPLDFAAVPADRPSTATITSYTPTRIVIAVDAAADGYLLLTDAFYPGWTASDSDDHQLEIFRADVMFRAIAVSVGQTTITLKNENPVYRVGFILGGAMWVLVIGGAAIAVIRRQQK